MKQRQLIFLSQKWAKKPILYTFPSSATESKDSKEDCEGTGHSDYKPLLIKPEVLILRPDLDVAQTFSQTPNIYTKHSTIGTYPEPISRPA